MNPEVRCYFSISYAYSPGAGKLCTRCPASCRPHLAAEHVVVQFSFTGHFLAEDGITKVTYLMNPSASSDVGSLPLLATPSALMPGIGLIQHATDPNEELCMCGEPHDHWVGSPEDKGVWTWPPQPKGYKQNPKCRHRFHD